MNCSECMRNRERNKKIEVKEEEEEQKKIINQTTN